MKPSNLLLDARGSVWVADFGLAKSSAAPAAGLTETGDLVGTLRYMAPERFRGECDARGDVYALGATLYELLALRPAFDDPDRLRLVGRIARGEPEPLRRLNAAVPRDLDTIVRKAMARRPVDRYSTATDLADDLGRFLEGRPVRARRASAAELAWRWARRRPAVAALSAMVVLLIVSAAIGGWWAAGALKTQVTEVTQAKQEMTERLWDARVAEARAVRVSRLPGQRLRGLDAIAEAASIRPGAVLRDEACACLALHDLRTEREWDEALESAGLTYSTGATFDPDLAHSAHTDATGAITVRAADGRVAARFDGPGFPADYLRFSPNGQYLAARFTSPSERRPLRVWDWRAGCMVLELPNAPQPMLSFDFHPDGRSAAVGGRGRVECYDLPSGAKVREISIGFAPCWLAFAPGGDRLAVAGERRVRIVPWAARGGSSDWPDLPTGVYAVAWRPDGGLLAASGQDGNVYTFDPRAEVPRAVLRGHQFEAREIAFTPDGTVLLSRGWDGTTRLWDPVDGRELLRVRGASFLQVSRDGRRVGYRGYSTARLGVWELVGGDICRVLYAPHGLTQQVHAALSFSPDGATLSAAGAGGLTLWDARTGRVTAHEPLGALTDVRFDPQGRWLLTGGPSARTRRFALRRDESGWHLGESETWPADVATPFQFGADRSGDVVAVVDRFRRVVLPRATGPALYLEGHPRVSFVAVSPDGRWVACGPWRGAHVRVWRAADGVLERELPTGETAGVAFAPGGNLLVLSADGTYKIHAANTFDSLREQSNPLAGFTRGLRIAFHPDRRTVAHTHDRVALCLADLQTGETRAVLPVPDSHNLAACEFSPDGRYVAAVTVRGAVQVWDLVRLKHALRNCGLDWP